MSDENAILERAALTLEKIATSIREKDFEMFDELTYDIEGVYCSINLICVDVELCEVREILERVTRGSQHDTDHISLAAYRKKGDQP